MYSSVPRSVLITRNTSPKTRALIKAAFDNSPDCSYIVRNRACSFAEKLTEYRYLAVSILGGRPPFPLWDDLFFSISRIFHVRPSACRYIHSFDSAAAELPVKKHRLRRCFHPLAGKLFSDAKNFSCSRKHSLLFAFCKQDRPPVGRTVEPAAVKTGKAASIHVGIVTRDKDTDLFNRLYNMILCRSLPLRRHKHP